MKFATHTLGLLLLAGAAPLAAAEADGTITATRSETVQLPSPGTVTIERTWGEVAIEGWDRPAVEVTVTARSKKSYPDDQASEMRARLAQFGFAANARSPSQVVVTGVSPKTSLLKPFGGKSGVSVLYTIHMPRSANLVVHHGVGEVGVKRIEGNVDVAARIGDVNLAVPLGNDVAVDGSAGVGEVSLKGPLRDKGEFKRHVLVGQSFHYRPAEPRRQIVAHVGIGSIAIE